MPGRDELPSTLQRSPDSAQETWAKAHDSAVQTYGEGERAHRTAFAALKHTHEKVGDHWEPKRRAGPPTSVRPVGDRILRGEARAVWTPTPTGSTCRTWPGGWGSGAGPR